mmetsp:Transcript_10163/g.37227  ORF Transcript_10163/g.37227 Transcript_10163/m.37227 type:complete len:292 (+) Transcript_10163:465-1340(+)
MMTSSDAVQEQAECILPMGHWDLARDLQEVYHHMSDCTLVSSTFDAKGKEARRARRHIDVPYVENNFCYEELHPPSLRTTAYYFRGSLELRVHRGHNKVREVMTKLNRLSNATIVDVHRENRHNFSKEAMALGMRSSTFCLVPHGDTAATSRFYDAIACECIPIVISDAFLGAFHEIVPYHLFTLRIREKDFVRDPIKQVVAVTHGADIPQMQAQLRIWSPWILYDHKDSKVVQHIGELLGLTGNRTSSDQRRLARTSTKPEVFKPSFLLLGVAVVLLLLLPLLRRRSSAL